MTHQLEPTTPFQAPSEDLIFDHLIIANETTNRLSFVPIELYIHSIEERIIAATTATADQECLKRTGNRIHELSAEKLVSIRELTKPYVDQRQISS